MRKKTFIRHSKMKNFFNFLLIFLLAIFTTRTNAGRLPRLVGNLTVAKPAFVTLIPNGVNNSISNLVISSFNGAPFSHDNVYYYANFSLNFPQPKQLNNGKLVWPNEVTYINETIFNVDTDPYGGLVVAGGFLVPSKTDGAVYYYPFITKDRVNITDRPPIILTNTPQKWFYHRVRYVDISGDGKKDFLTCRANKPVIGATLVQLVGLVFDEMQKTFRDYVISNDSCDIFFDFSDIDNDGRIEIIAAGFFIEQLNIIYSNHPNNSFIDGNAVVKTIDNSCGKLFDVLIYDLDKHGNKELLVSNHQGIGDRVRGTVYFFVLVGNIRNGTWIKILVYDDFPVRKIGINEAAPGGAKIFYPNANDTSVRPYLVIAGDGAEHAYVFRPVKTDPLYYLLDWQQRFPGNTIGGIGIGDINNDNFTDILVPAYEANKVYIYTYAP